jgi:hypothetical protein
MSRAELASLQKIHIHAEQIHEELTCPTDEP